MKATKEMMEIIYLIMQEKGLSDMIKLQYRGGPLKVCENGTRRGKGI